MISNLREIRKEATKRAKHAIETVRPQNLSRKEIRAIAFSKAKSTIELMNKIDNDENLTELQIDLLAHKATLVAMKSFYN